MYGNQFKELQMAGEFSNQRDGYSNQTVLSAPKLALRKITFNSVDGTELATHKTWRFNLTSPLYNVVFIDWSMAVDFRDDALIRIDEIPSYGITTTNQGYFTLIPSGTSVNLCRQTQPAVKFNPISLSALTITFSFLKPALTQNKDWHLELYFYIED